jgi:hypothetical protein
MQFDEDGRVTAILFAHPESLTYLQAYLDVLLLDCSYKTNKYGMPLLDMIGVDACQWSFCIVFAFLSGETEDDFRWALERLRSLYDHHCTRFPSVVLTDRCIACMNAVAAFFPTSYSLLCLWHANKAVLRRCLPAFATRGAVTGSDFISNETEEAWGEFYRFWHLLMNAPDEEVFKERLVRFGKKYVPDHLEEVGYVRSTWLDPYKEKLVKAWVDHHAHFGNTATSRVDGIHALLKSHLQKSTLDLFEAWRAMKQALLNQLAELRSNQVRQQTRVPIELLGPLYSMVRGWVSHEALRKVEEQRKLMEKKDPPPSLRCTGMFTKSHGLPCMHVLKVLQDNNEVLSLEHFHSHWHLQRDGAPQILLEPRQLIESRAHAAAASKISSHSTRREPSAFEHVGLAKKAPPKCTNCGEVGHSRRSRACRLRFAEIFSTTTANPIVAPQPTEMVAMVQPLGMDGTQVIGLTAPDALRRRGDPPLAPVDVVGRHTPLAAGSVSPPQSPPAASHEDSATSSQQKETGGAPQYDSPQAIYERYVAARAAWYATQPAGSIKTNQQYRRAVGLPPRYDKASYEWCLDYKQMNRRCITPAGSRDWTKEEMMAYLDWSAAEDNRIEAQVLKELGPNPMSGGRRGVKDIWKAIEQDTRAQETLHSGGDLTERCIVVRP